MYYTKHELNACQTEILKDIDSFTKFLNTGPSTSYDTEITWQKHHVTS